MGVQLVDGVRQWMPPNLSREMQRYHEGGLGGIQIIPIYGAKGAESRYVEYLSPAVDGPAERGGPGRTAPGHGRVT